MAEPTEEDKSYFDQLIDYMTPKASAPGPTMIYPSYLDYAQGTGGRPMRSQELTPEQQRRAASALNIADPQTGKVPEPRPDMTGFDASGAEQAPVGPSELERLARIGAYGGSADYQQAYDDFAAGQQQYRDMLKEQQAAVTQSQSRIAQMQQQALTEYQNQQRGREVLRQVNERARTKARADIKSTEDSITNFKIDPNGAFPSLGGKIMAAISIAVGAFAQGLSKGQIPNTALRIITDAANRDIESQKMQLAKQRTVLSNKNNLYGQLLTEHGNAEKAYNLAMNGALHFANMKIQQAMNSHKGMETQQRLAQLLQVSTQAQEKLKLDVIKQTKGDHQTHFLNRLAIEQQNRKGLTGTGKQQAISIEGVIPLVNRLITISDQIEQEGADGQRFLAAGLDFVGLRALAKDVGTELHQKWFANLTYAAQGIMKAFQGSKPSDADWKIFISSFPSLANRGKTRGNTLRAIAEALNEQSQGGKKLLKPGALVEMNARGQLGKGVKMASDKELQAFKDANPDLFSGQATTGSVPAYEFSPATGN